MELEDEAAGAGAGGTDGAGVATSTAATARATALSHRLGPRLQRACTCVRTCPSCCGTSRFGSRQARELGLGATLLGGDGFEAPQLLEIGGAALEGACYATHFSAENRAPESQRFVAAFRARHGAVPNGLSALSYDAVRLVADAIRRAGTTERAALRAALAATRDFPGVTGRTTLNASRDADKEATIMRVAGGRVEFVETVRP